MSQVKITEFTTTYTTYNWSITDQDDISPGTIFHNFIPTQAVPFGSWGSIHKSIKERVIGIKELLFTSKFTQYMNEGEDLWKKLKELEISELKKRGRKKKTLTDAEYASLISSFVGKSPTFADWPTVKDEIETNIKQLRDAIVENENSNRTKSTQAIKLWLNRSKTETPDYLQLTFIDDKISFDYTMSKVDQKERKDILLDIDRAFPKLKFETLELKDVKGYFNIQPSSPAKEFQEYVFMDLVTNDEQVSKYLSKSELDKTDKKWYTIGYHARGNDSVKPGLSFTVKSLGDEYGTHRVSIYDYQSYESIVEFRKQFALIMDRYEEVYDDIVAAYEEYGISMDDESDDEEGEDDVEEENTQIVWKGGSSKCAKKRRPPGFTNEEAAKKEWNKIFGESNPKKVAFEDSHLILKNEGNAWNGNAWWVCNMPATPYIYRKVDSPEYPPCCYTEDQSGKKDRVTKATSYTIQTDAPLTKDGSVGVINNSINFLQKYNTPGFKYERYYMGSGIMEILIAIRPDTPVKSLRPELAKQESWRKCKGEIMDTLKQGNIDYRDYATLLEETFKVNLAVYNSEGRVVPNFKNGYFRRANDYPFVMIYDQSPPGSPPSYVLIQNSPNAYFIKGVREILDSKIVTKVDGKEVTDTDLSTLLVRGWRVKYQKFDAYGKARRFVITNGVDVLTIQTTPQQPFDAPERLIPYIKPYTIQKMQILKDAIGATDYKVEGSDAVFDYSSFKIQVPMNIPEVTESPYLTTSPVSEYVRSIKLKRLARLVTENVIWTFVNDELSESDFDNKDRLIGKLQGFIQKIKVMDKDSRGYEGIISKKFSKENTNLYKDGSIQVYSTKIIYKLVYILQNIIIRNPGKLRSYKNATVVPNFYKDYTDFLPRFAQSDQTSMNQDEIDKMGDFNCTLYDVFNDLDILIERK